MKDSAAVGATVPHVAAERMVGSRKDAKGSGARTEGAPKVWSHLFQPSACPARGSGAGGSRASVRLKVNDNRAAVSADLKAESRQVSRRRSRLRARSLGTCRQPTLPGRHCSRSADSHALDLTSRVPANHLPTRRPRRARRASIWAGRRTLISSMRARCAPTLIGPEKCETPQ